MDNIPLWGREEEEGGVWQRADVWCVASIILIVSPLGLRLPAWWAGGANTLLCLRALMINLIQGGCHNR